MIKKSRFSCLAVLHSATPFSRLVFTVLFFLFPLHLLSDAMRRHAPTLQWGSTVLVAVYTSVTVHSSVEDTTGAFRGWTEKGSMVISIHCCQGRKALEAFESCCKKYKRSHHADYSVKSTCYK